MHHFFGIIQTAGSARTDCFEVLRSKFPTAFGGAKTVADSPALSIMGDIARAAIPGRSALYLCGELYPTDGAAAPPSVEQLLAGIESRGLADTAVALNGRFLLCYMDYARQQAHILTDQMGIQQVFYHCGDGFLVFASELRFLLQHPLCPRQIDWHNALRRSLPFEVLDGEVNYHAWFRDVFLLEEATDLCTNLQTGATAKKNYWNPYAAATPATDARSAQQVMDEYMELLEDAVRIRIHDTDTAFSFLSGGLDSSIICSMAARVKPLETFSIITQTTMLEDTSEMCFRLAAGQGFGNTQFVVPMHRLDGDTDRWKKRVWRAESPLNHNDSMTKTLLHDAIRRHNPGIGYVLTGTGSDQMNGGLARWITADADTPEENWQNLIGRIADAERRHHIPERLFATWGARHYLTRDFVAGVSGQALERNPFLFYVKSNVHINQFVLLWDENRAAYSHRHSARYPFLDHRFLPFIAGIPERLHAELFYDKQILRVPAARYLPDYILNKPKAPAETGMYDRRFETYKKLLRPDKLDLLEEALGPLHEPHPAIDKKALVRELERLVQQPDHKAWQYLLNVVNLGLLEQLPLQDEASMNYEDALHPHIQTVKTLDAPAKARLSRELDIVPEADLLRKPLGFAPGCSLVTEHGSGKTYLQKDEILRYELDPEEPAWQQFLFTVDGKRSTSQLLEAQAIDFEQIRDYFYLCLKEAILKIDSIEPIEPIQTNA